MFVERVSKKSKFADFIRHQSKTGNLSHAYLVFGSFNPVPFKETYKVNEPDIFIVEEAPIKIGQIRELIHWLYIKPHSSLLKLVVLHGAENMTTEAANSLLKVLEEPPSYAIFVLQASSKGKILPTILSRCQIIYEQEEKEKDIPKNFLSAERIAQMSLKERFDYAGKITDEENLVYFINLWEKEIRLKLLRGNDARETLQSISKVRSLLLTNTSLKLLLENLFIKF